MNAWCRAQVGGIQMIPRYRRSCSWLAGNPQMYGNELQRQLAAGAGPYNIQAAQVPRSNGVLEPLYKPRHRVEITVLLHEVNVLMRYSRVIALHTDT